MTHPLQWLFSLMFHYSRILKPGLSDERASEGSFTAVNTLLLFPLMMLTDVVEYLLGIDLGVTGVITLWLAMCFGIYHLLKPATRWAQMTARYPHKPVSKTRVYMNCVKSQAFKASLEVKSA
ncbi:hypothetical protein H8B13_04015 [Hymenobacter sp. BT188]|uniref:hypothetical protein n=1 Tax=Hymenobacter sp. BT188 TaxID=2763504 RepID=UPI001650F2B5|nr:hypothetical protein [Hymenobacter sp. BT188]MBC6605976.1 hypothetical protein [Hymenobacter sp. BT188]